MLSNTQMRGKKWLTTNYGLKPDEIEYTGDVPTFATKNGGFLTKRVFGKDKKTVVFHPHEMQELMQDVDHNTVLLVSDSGEVKAMPARHLAEDGDEFDGVHIILREQAVTNGTQGEVLLHLSPRGSGSRNFRVNYVPIESLLVTRDFTGRLSVSSAKGKPDLWLALRPEYYGIG